MYTHARARARVCLCVFERLSRRFSERLPITISPLHFCVYARKNEFDN